MHMGPIGKLWSCEICVDFIYLFIFVLDFTNYLLNTINHSLILQEGKNAQSPTQCLRLLFHFSLSLLPPIPCSMHAL